ncbi:MAG TPA: hypothetical protein DCG06_09520 [Deltaproteobacteria bacterium]|nr:hypothetical protein [Deltaproteobacteria bacterium]
MSHPERKLSDKWFEQWAKTDSYMASDGHSNRIPLRLASTNVVLYGKAKLSEVLKEFEHEDHRPVTVAGDVPVQLWCNNFVDTDCGPADQINPYVETWYSFPVTPKSAPLDLPYESPFSYNVDAPEALVWCHRVLCAPASDGYALGAIAAIAGGREVWGFPKHPDPATLRFAYPDDETVVFEGAHQGHKAVALKIKRPESVEGHITVPLDVRTGEDTCITPRQHPSKATFVAKQTRYGQAFAATMNFSPWDEATDSITIYDEEDYFGGLLKSWAFEPSLKMHCSDLKIVAFKPAGWGG